MRSILWKKSKTIGVGILLGMSSLSISGISPQVTVASEGVDQCQPVSVVSVSVTHSWPRACEEYECWRKITMFTEGRLELADEDGFHEAAMDAESQDALRDILENSELLVKLDNPLAPDCPGWDGVDDTEIRVELSNGASLSTKWAGGCRSIEGHPYKRVNDLAIAQRIAHIECEPFESALFEEDFDRNDLLAMDAVKAELYGRSYQNGLCFPCGGLC